MWCRDAQHREPCSLCDIHLPPHSGRVHWLGDWEVDFSPLAGCAPHYAPALLRKSRSISSCGNCDPELRSPSISPHRSPGTVTTEVTSSSVGSLEVVVTTTVNSPTVTVSPHPPSLPPPNTDFKDGGMYGGSDEGFVYATTPSCDAKGWIYLSRSSSCGWVSVEVVSIIQLKFENNVDIFIISCIHINWIGAFLKHYRGIFMRI